MCHLNMPGKSMWMMYDVWELYILSRIVYVCILSWQRYIWRHKH